MDCSLPGSSIHGILQARVLEWVAIAYSGEYAMCAQKMFSSLSCEVLEYTSAAAAAAKSL